MGRIAISISGTFLWAFSAIAVAGPGLVRYQVDVNEVANNCEYFIDKFGAAYDESGSQWLETVIQPHQLIVSGQAGSVLAVGAAVTYLRQEGGESPTEIILGKVSGSSYLVVIPYTDTFREGVIASNHCIGRIRRFNIFIDLKNPAGRVFRLWAAPIEQLLDLESVFWGYPFSFRERGSGSGITYTFHPSPIMKLKSRCADSEVKLGAVLKVVMPSAERVGHL